jgi:serine-type D-Ala-D-Ala carboxypeptidase (penicillin-binding protein 5/6)
MKFRWFHSVAAAAAFAVAALAAAPGPLPAAPATLKLAQGKIDPSKRTPVVPTEIVGPVDTQAKYALIIDADTGAVLLDKGGDTRIPPASMSKVMTAYVVFDMLKQGRASLDDELLVSEKAWRTGGSKMFVPLGERIKIGDLLRGVVVQSGNDACVVLAEGLAGSEEAFVAIMNEKAKEIGLTGSHFANVHGWPDPEHWMTPRDLVTLAQRMISDFPEYYTLYSETEFTFNKIKQNNRNPLLYRDIGADGLKTGYTEEAGYSLLASVKRGDRRIVMVLSGLPTMRSRAQESERLAQWAFREYNNYLLFSAGARVEDAEVWLGVEPKVPLTVEQDFVVTLPRKSRKDMKVTIVYDQPAPAPIEQGQQLGKAVVTAPDMPAVETPLYAASTVERMGPFGRMAMVAAHLIWGTRH